MKVWRNSLVLSVATVAIFVSGYAFLRYAFRVADGLPFTQELVLLVLGTLTTVFITALLLNRQTEVELRKEQSVKFIELKSEIYQRLIDYIEQLLLSSRVTPDDKVRLQFHAHRLAIVASPDVLVEFENFLETLDAPSESGQVTLADSEAISRALARLSVSIRADLVGELDQSQTKYTKGDIARQISENIDEALDA